MILYFLKSIHHVTQRAYNAMIKSWRQNDVATSFWRHSVVILRRLSDGKGLVGLVELI